MIDGLEIGLPPLDHNQPVVPTELGERTDALIETVNRWLRERSIITDAEQAGAAQLLIDQLRAVRDDLANALDTARAPHDDAIELLRDGFKQPQQLVVAALDRMRPMVTTYLQADRRRREDEARKRAAEADAAKAKANAAIERAVTQPSVQNDLAAQQLTAAALDAEEAAKSGPEPARVKGDYAKRAMSLHARWKARVVDPALALEHYLDHGDVRTAALRAIVQVASKDAKAFKGDATKAPPGIEFFNDESAV